MSNNSDPEDYRVTIVLENQRHPEVEAEEVWLVCSGILQKLLADASQQAPIEEWECMLDEL